MRPIAPDELEQVKAYYEKCRTDSIPWSKLSLTLVERWVARWLQADETESDVKVTPDLINHPPHYTSNPSGVECIQVTEHLNFCIGNAIKYLWRTDDKGDALENLRKARWYINREIARRGGDT